MKHNRKTSKLIYAYAVLFPLTSCGYIKVFDGKNDELIVWNPVGGFETDPNTGSSGSPDTSGTPSDQAVATECAQSLNESTLSFSAGDNASSVTSSFYVPQTISDCSISWSLNAEDSNYVSISGASASVTRPRSLTDKTATLVATVRSGSATVRKTIAINIKSGVYDIASFKAANECQSGFNSGIITLSGSDSASSVTQDFTLPSTVTINGNSCAITSWSSNDPAISLNGGTATVSRPADNASDETVTLTSYVNVNGETATLPITITLKVKKFTETETVTECQDNLTTDDFSDVIKLSATSARVLATTPSITFPTSLSGGSSSLCSVTWSPSNTAYLSVSGGVGTVTASYDASDTIVTLTPTISRGAITDSSKTFSLTIKSKFTSSKTLAAFDNSGGNLGVSYNAATTSDAATIKYKVCYSLDSSLPATINSMDTGDAALFCQFEAIAYPNIAAPLSFSVGAAPGSIWFARVYAYIEGQPDQDDKKILYNLGTAEF